MGELWRQQSQRLGLSRAIEYAAVTTPLYFIHNLAKQRQREKGYKLWIRNLSIPQHAKIALLGPSGCGKSTTLDILGLALAPDRVDSFLFSPNPNSRPRDLKRLWESRAASTLAAIRRLNIGYVLQTGELLPYLSAGENICLTARLKGLNNKSVLKTGQELAAKLDIAHLWQERPQTLSIGERQRVAIARALAARPDIILADEPTAALDPLHAAKVMDVFLECINIFGAALILATHNAQWAASGGFKRINFKLVEKDSGVIAIVDDRED